MLSSIHPLGERGRNNRWGTTVGAFTLASVLTAGLVGWGLGSIGRLVGGFDSGVTLGLMGAVAIVAGLLDLAKVPHPGPSRQVNEHWIGYYRGWVYGGAFGGQLGLGLATYVVTWTVYATLIAEFLTASPTGGAAIGIVFGFGRSIALIFAARIRRPSDLREFHRMMDRLGPRVRRLAISATGVAGLIAVTGVLL